MKLLIEIGISVMIVMIVSEMAVVLNDRLMLMVRVSIMSCSVIDVWNTTFVVSIVNINVGWCA